jgi:hypothetical protein
MNLVINNYSTTDGWEYMQLDNGKTYRRRIGDLFGSWEPVINPLHSEV